MGAEKTDEYKEMYSIAMEAIASGTGKEFIEFLCYCVPKIDKGEPTQAIWNDYQQIMNRIG